MTKPRRLLTSLCLVPVLAACNQLPAALSGGGGEEKTADAKTDGAKKQEAGKTPDAPATAVPMPTGPATTDDLLGLVDSAGRDYVVLKTPDTFLQLAETAISTFEAPALALAQANPEGNNAAEISQGINVARTTIAAAKVAMAQAGINLSRGVVVSETSAGEDPVIVFTATDAAAAKNFLTSVKLPDAESMTCQPVSARAGYVSCSKNQAALAAYKPGEAAAVRAKLDASLPGVVLDEAAAFAHVDEGKVDLALSSPAGALVFHVGAPPDAREVFKGLAAGQADLLRFVPAGTGFIWGRLDVVNAKNTGLDLGPFASVVDGLSGEFLFGSSSDPAALQARVGHKDTAQLAALLELGYNLVKAQIPSKIPDLTGARLSSELVDLTFGADKTKALHFAVSGVSQAKPISESLGMGLDAWVFAAEGTLALVLGPDAKGVVNVRAPGAVDATLTSLPADLARGLRAGEVAMVAHVPFDGLQSPALLKLADDSLKSVKGYNPNLARTALKLFSPLSSGTVWITEHGDSGVFHFSVQTIGHTADEEGKAALLAAASPDPVAAFGELAKKYPSSPRLASYNLRAGQGGSGAIVAGAAPALFALGAAGFFLFRSMPPDALTPVMVPPVLEPAPVEDPKKEEPKKEEPKKTEPKKTEPKKEEPKKEEPKKEEPKKEEPKKEEPKKVGPLKAEPSTPKRVGRVDPTPG